MLDGEAVDGVRRAWQAFLSENENALFPGALERLRQQRLEEDRLLSDTPPLAYTPCAGDVGGRDLSAPPLMFSWERQVLQALPDPTEGLMAMASGLTVEKIRRVRQMMDCMPSGFATVQPRDASRGEYLCETCWDAMTNAVVPGRQTATGLDEARCAACHGSQ